MHQLMIWNRTKKPSADSALYKVYVKVDVSKLESGYINRKISLEINIITDLNR